jgi:hypothetical protein
VALDYGGATAALRSAVGKPMRLPGGTMATVVFLHRYSPGVRLGPLTPSWSKGSGQRDGDVDQASGSIQLAPDTRAYMFAN